MRTHIVVVAGLSVIGLLFKVGLEVTQNSNLEDLLSTLGNNVIHTFWNSFVSKGDFATL